MEVLISDQLISCLVFAVIGVLSGFVYDLFRTVRCLFLRDDRSFKFKIILNAIIDFVFDLSYMLCLAVALTVAAYCYSKGKLRLFNIVSFALAYWLYRKTLGKLYAVTVRPLAEKIRVLSVFLILTALKPLKFIVKLLNSFIQMLYSVSVGRIICVIKASRQEKYFARVLEGLPRDLEF